MIIRVRGIKTMKSFKAGAIIAAVAIVVLVIIMFSCTTTIKPGYVGIVYNMNGGVEDTVLPQGWHMIAPWKSITSYPVSTETIYLSAHGKEGGNDNDSVNAGTADGKPINMDVSYTYHFDPSKLKQVFTKFRGQSSQMIADTYIRREVKNELSVISTQYGIFDIYGTKRSEVADKVYKGAVAELSKDGIIVESFNITDVRPDNDTMKAIQNKVNAIQALEQVKVEAEKAKIEAEKKKTEAEGDAAKKRIEADAQAYANQKLQQSATKEVIELEWIKKWDGKVPVVGGNNSNILDINSLMGKSAGK